MLRTNLSTRPFYNERALYIALAALAVLAIGLALFGLVRVISLSQRQAELGARIERDEAEAARLLQSAARVRRGIDQSELNAVVAAAREANAVIAQRTFSWTELFNRIEATLPPDVMLTSVRPSFDKGETYVAMTLVGRSVENVGRFMEQLEAKGAFENVLLGDEKRGEDGMFLVTLRGLYRGDQESGIRNQETGNGNQETGNENQDSGFRIPDSGRLAMSEPDGSPKASRQTSRTEARR
jgi:Tfp pilus assembly protein PilN